MKTIDLGKEQHSLNDVLALAKEESVFIHSSTGEDFLLESADDFDREVATLGASEKFISFLETRSKETDRIPLSEVRKKYGL